MACEDRDDRTVKQRVFTWPLLVAAALMLAGAAWMVNEPIAQESLASGLVALSAVLLGAWIAMLARSGYSGRDRD